MSSSRWSKNGSSKKSSPRQKTLPNANIGRSNAKRPIGLIILRKTLDVVRGEMNLFDDVRYFFYITNDRKRSANQMIHFYRGRSDHENDIEQLKNGVKALDPASDTLLSNWALMTIASLAWDLKAWFGLLLSYRPLGLSVVRMEFKRFLNTFMRIPCLVVRTGRRICYRIVGYNDKLAHVIKFSDRMKSFGFHIVRKHRATIAWGGCEPILKPRKESKRSVKTKLGDRYLMRKNKTGASPQHPYFCHGVASRLNLFD
jgi:hypothetical protein